MIIAPALRKPVASVGRRLHLINAPPLPLHSSSIQNILLIPHLWPYVFPATAYMLIYTSLPSNIAQTSLYQTGRTYQLLFTTMIENPTKHQRTNFNSVTSFHDSRIYASTPKFLSPSSSFRGSPGAHPHSLKPP